ncbi:MAG: exodeoxyribonuclease VII small subunit [Gammaproteobacteria bacterium]|nr:exodeoxyribonuclease VII small subunit [Gammaproteobacteria bacterium]|tara:strand:- start:3090 stop:3335 length:246 start_codon:yes stop_codon:yes gene_type:complete
MAEAPAEPFPFEAALAQLEALVARLEGGELSLEDSLTTFEEGIRLTRQCQQALRSAEQKVALLMEKGGTVPFDPEDDAGES